MTIEQTVEIPASHRLTIDVPRAIPAGPTILAFTPTANPSEDGSEGEAPPLPRSFADRFAGSLRVSDERYEEMQALVREWRGEWERDIF